MQLSSAELAKFRDDYAKTHSRASVNTALDCIQPALTDAYKDNLIDTNEAKRVARLPDPLSLGSISISSIRQFRFDTEKTDRATNVPIAESFYRYLMEIAGDPTGPLFPNPYALRQHAIPTGTLQTSFTESWKKPVWLKSGPIKRKRTVPAEAENANLPVSDFIVSATRQRRCLNGPESATQWREKSCGSARPLAYSGSVFLR